MLARASQRLPADQRRELLLQAAAELFATRGYHATDVASIAAATGVTKVIVYRAFGTKQALYEALLEHHRDELLSTIVRSQQSATENRAARLRAGLEAWFAYVQNHPFAWRLLFRDTTGLPALEARHRRMRAQARELLAGLLVEHFNVDPAEAEPTAEFFRSGIVGIALWWLENPDLTREQILHTSERLTTGALTSMIPS